MGWSMHTLQVTDMRLVSSFLFQLLLLQAARASIYICYMVDVIFIYMLAVVEVCVSDREGWAWAV